MSRCPCRQMSGSPWRRSRRPARSARTNRRVRRMPIWADIFASAHRCRRAQCPATRYRYSCRSLNGKPERLARVRTRLGLPLPYSILGRRTPPGWRGRTDQAAASRPGYPLVLRCFLRPRPRAESAVAARSAGPCQAAGRMFRRPAASQVGNVRVTPENRVRNSACVSPGEPPDPRAHPDR